MKDPIVQRQQASSFTRAAQCALFIALLTLGCATPPTPQALIDAQAAYKGAAANEQIQQNASVELLEAKRALDRAESEWGREHDTGETEHLAYLVKRRVEVAQLWASGRAAAKESEALRRELTPAAEDAKRAADEAAERERKLREELSELQARDTARGLELTLGDILFGVDQANLQPAAMQNLNRLATFLKQYPDRAVLVEGFTDSTGSDTHNQSLSERRAESVRSFLIESGIAAGRVLARGYGKAYPIAPNNTTEGRQLNRRVGIVILHPGESPEGRLRPPA